jgi:hypothetical protein
MKAIYVWAAVIIELLAYEGWAYWTGHQTLSGFVWSIDLAPYGLLLPLLAGGLSAHFFAVDAQNLQAFAFGFLGTWLFWHRIK